MRVGCRGDRQFFMRERSLLLQGRQLLVGRVLDCVLHVLVVGVGVGGGYQHSGYAFPTLVSKHFLIFIIILIHGSRTDKSINLGHIITA